MKIVQIAESMDLKCFSIIHIEIESEKIETHALMELVVFFGNVHVIVSTNFWLMINIYVLRVWRFMQWHNI